MGRYLVACELNRPGDDYIEFTEAIERLSVEARPCLKTLWVVVADKTAVEIRDELRRHLGESDQLLVTRLSDESAWHTSDQRLLRGMAALFARSDRR